MRQSLPRWFIAGATLVMGCVGAPGTTGDGTGGAITAGGSSGAGGVIGGSGGASASGGGGTSSSGGSPATGGRASSGGAVGSGGAASGGRASMGSGGAGSGGSPNSGGGPGSVSTGGQSPGGRGGAGGPGTSGGRGGDAGANPSGGTTGGGGAGAQPYKGLASYNGCTDVAALNLSWYYTWSPSSSCTSNAEFVPMIWGHADENIANEIAQAGTAGRKNVLGFNEPDTATQSNMTVAQATALWPKLTVNPSIRVGSPATSANANGQTWFANFMNQVAAQNLRVDFVALHWYGWNAGSCDNASALESYLKWAEGLTGNRPIWITEWGCLNVSAPSAQTVEKFYAAAIAMFKNHPRIERYSWYLSRSTDNNNLVTSTGVLTPLGAAYAAAPGVK